MFEQRAEGQGDIYEPVVPLDEMTTKALSVVSRDRDGFFLMVEEEGIDEFAHRNNAGKVIQTGQALDRAVDAADESGTGVSAEDGPFTIAGTNLQFSVDWTTGNHTGESTPLTAEGPGSRALARVQKNTEVHDAILGAMRLR